VVPTFIYLILNITSHESFETLCLLVDIHKLDPGGSTDLMEVAIIQFC
jgi:hypothetical protein